MAKDSRPDGQASGSVHDSVDLRSPAQLVGDATATATGGPVPFIEDDLSDADLADIKSLLSQKPDITRHNLPPIENGGSASPGRCETRREALAARAERFIHIRDFNTSITYR